VNRPLRLAQWLAFGVPALLLGGAYLAQYGFGLFPCEMCWWQRYPHFAALALALLSMAVRAARAVDRAGRGWRSCRRGYRAFHAGVEYGWWEGITSCSSPIESAGGDRSRRS
jgi:disulfide bond formation protein DsbB